MSQNTIRDKSIILSLSIILGKYLWNWTLLYLLTSFLKWRKGGGGDYVSEFRWSSVTDGTDTNDFFILCKVQIDSILDSEKLTIQIRKFMITFGGLQLLARLLFFHEQFYKWTPAISGLIEMFACHCYHVFSKITKSRIQ